MATSDPGGAEALRYDIFNGDADGLCALHQLRLAEPAQSELITGVKRDVSLLRRVPSGAREVLVLDISLDCNAEHLRRLLDGGARVRYFDHHSADRVFTHPGLQLHWNDSPEVCTSMLVDRYLDGRYRAWAVVAAFGDNLTGPARALAREMGLDAEVVADLAQLGQVLNYNAYGECVDDLCIAPDLLYRALSPYTDPFDFIASSPQYRMLCEGYHEDCIRMYGLRPHWQRADAAVYLLPAAPWAQRIGGVFANRLAAQQAGASFAVLNARADGAYVVSVRSGAPEQRSACGLCQQFASGGGRRAAAGINRLPAAELDRFIDLFGRYFAPNGPAGHA